MKYNEASDMILNEQISSENEFKELHDIINKKGHEFVKNYAEEQERKAWKEIKLECIADKVNEDWLESKMLCFMKRCHVATITKRDYEDDVIDYLSYPIYYDEECNNSDCPFCFPEDKPEEQPREKVTVIELLELVNKLSSGDLNPNRELNMYRHRHIINKRREILDIFEQKLEYLVSLQEKE